MKQQLERNNNQIETTIGPKHHLEWNKSWNETTIGTEHYLSTISTFKLADPSASQNINTTTEVEAQALTDPVTDPILITLKDFLGKDFEHPPKRIFR